jgi:hypothetical protein
VKIEQAIRVAHHGIEFGGFIDANWREDDRAAVVLDHKTTKDFGYAKLTKEALLNHPQAPIYALWAMQHYRVDYVELRWNYARTVGKPKPIKSWHLVNRGEILQAMQAPLKVAKRMLAVVQDVNTRRSNGEHVSAKDLDFNLDACGAFGGCPYQGVCNPGDYADMGKPSFINSLKSKAAPQAPQEAPLTEVLAASIDQINPPERVETTALPTPESITAGTEAEVDVAPKKPRKPRQGKLAESIDALEVLDKADGPAIEVTDEALGRAVRTILFAIRFG